MTVRGQHSRRGFLLGGCLAFGGCRGARDGYFDDTTAPAARRILFESGSEPDHSSVEELDAGAVEGCMKGLSLRRDMHSVGIVPMALVSFPELVERDQMPH